MTKLMPKWSQHLSKIDPGGGLEATWEPPLKQGASKTSCLMILAPFWDPLWDQFGVMLGIIFVDVFLKWLFDGLGLHLGSQKTSKMRSKRVSKTKAEFHPFCFYLLHFGHIQRCWKSWFVCCFFGTLFWDGFGSPFGWFWLTFGVPFGDNFDHFLGAIFTSIFRPPKNIEKWRGPSAEHSLKRTVPPSSDSSP